MGDAALPRLRSREVNHGMNAGSDLAVQRGPVEPSTQGQRFQSRWDFRGRVGMQRSGASVVASVERRQQINNLRATDFADNEPIRSHPQSLPNQVTHGDCTHPFYVRRAGL